MPISMDNTTLTFNNGTTMTTAATGTVSSVATGNGLQGGTITTSGTLSVACPSINTVGSYIFGAVCNVNGGGQSNPSYNSNYSAGSGHFQVRSAGLIANFISGTFDNTGTVNNLSGTWKWMSGTVYTNADQGGYGLLCRVS